MPATLALVSCFYIVALEADRRPLRGAETAVVESVHGPSRVPMLGTAAMPRRIAVAVDFSAADGAALSYAVGLAQNRRRPVDIVLLHVVESGGARVIGGEVGIRRLRPTRRS